MGALVGLGVGIGLLLVWSAFFLPRTPRERSASSGRLRQSPRKASSPATTAPTDEHCSLRASSQWPLSRSCQ